MIREQCRSLWKEGIVMKRFCLFLLTAALLLGLTLPAVAELVPGTPVTREMMDRFGTFGSDFLQPPPGLKASVKQNRVVLSWKKGFGADGYVVYEYRKNAGPEYVYLGETRKLSFTLSNVAKGEHTYAVRSFQRSSGELQSELEFRVTVKIAGALKVGAVSKIRWEQTGTKKLKLTWSKATRAQKYIVYRSTKATKGFEKIKTLKGTSFTDKLPKTGKTYYYKIVAVGTVKGKTYRTVAPVQRVKVKKNYTGKAAGTTRALLIGNTYPDTKMSLPGPDNDIAGVKSMLGMMTKSDVQVTSLANATGDGIRQGIRTAFAGATEDDISIFYYSGHGVGPGEDEEGYPVYSSPDLGALVGVDEDVIITLELRKLLDQIPGKKVVFLDSCFSGEHIYDENAISVGAVARRQTVSAKRINQAVLRAFASGSRSEDNLVEDGYYVITAASFDQPSVSMAVGPGRTRFVGKMTHALLKGCGYNLETGKRTYSFPADRNGDSDFTISELFNYIDNYLAISYMEGQSTQSWWPDNGQDQIIWQR